MLIPQRFLFVGSAAQAELNSLPLALISIHDSSQHWQFASLSLSLA
jgi:hypothetical protein